MELFFLRPSEGAKDVCYAVMLQEAASTSEYLMEPSTALVSGGFDNPR